MRFTKMQGVGNDFVVLSLEDTIGRDLSELARNLCRRGFSVGADGLLVIGAGSGAIDFSFRMFNPDGSEDMCGNGLRCACLWAYNHHNVTPGTILVSTRFGDRQCELITASASEAVVTVNMGPAHLLPHEIPLDIPSNDPVINYPINVLDRTFLSTAVNTGSTHTVVFLDGPIDEDVFQRYSPAFEKLQIYPERTSVLWTWPVSTNRVNVRIWERGAGETLGCGTGACATGVAAVLNGYADRSEPVIVASKGGELTIDWREDIYMTGPAVLVYTGELTDLID